MPAALTRTAKDSFDGLNMGLNIVRDRLRVHVVHAPELNRFENSRRWRFDLADVFARKARLR